MLNQLCSSGEEAARRRYCGPTVTVSNHRMVIAGAVMLRHSADGIIGRNSNDIPNTIR